MFHRWKWKPKSIESSPWNTFNYASHLKHFWKHIKWTISCLLLQCKCSCHPVIKTKYIAQLSRELPGARQHAWSATQRGITHNSAPGPTPKAERALRVTALQCHYWRNKYTPTIRFLTSAVTKWHNYQEGFSTLPTASKIKSSGSENANDTIKHL